MPRAGIVLPEIKMCKSNGCANIATGYNGHCYSCDSRSALRNYSESPIPRRTIKNPMGVEIECYNPETVTKVTHVAKFVCRDGSLPSGGGEIKLCGPEAKLENVAADTVQRSRIVGNMVNKKCGLHVHMKIQELSGGRSLEICKRLFKFSKSLEGFMFDIVPQSRKGNQYCSKLECVYDMVRHHSWISLSDRYPTLEVRIHSGTMNPWKVKGWINAWMQIRPYIDQVASGSDGWEEIVTKVSGNGVLDLLDRNSIGYRYLKARETANGTLSNFGFNITQAPQQATSRNSVSNTRYNLSYNQVCSVNHATSEYLANRRDELADVCIEYEYIDDDSGLVCTNFNREFLVPNCIRTIYRGSLLDMIRFPANANLGRMFLYEGMLYILTLDTTSARCWKRLKNLPTRRMR